MATTSTVDDEAGDVPDGRLIELVADGLAPFERTSRLEPSLLPHLANLVHPVSIDDVVQAAYVFGASGHPQHWPQLHESVRNTLARRFDDPQLAAAWGVDPLEWAVRRCLATGADPTPELWERVTALADHTTRAGLLARLLVMDPEAERFDAIDPDLGWHDAETERCLLELALHFGRDHPLLDHDALEQLAGTDPARAAHVLPSLPVGQRAHLAESIAGAITGRWMPAWTFALYVSRLAPHRAPDAPWDASVDPADDPVWNAWIDRLRGMPAVDRERDTRRAHPFAQVLERIPGPHESTVPLPGRMIDLHGGAPLQSGAPPDEAPPLAVPSQPAPPPAPVAPPATPAPAPVAPPASVAPPAPVPPPSVPGGVVVGDRDVTGDLPSVFPGGEPAAPDTADDRRLGVDLFADGRLLPNAAVAGVPTDVEISIGRGATAQVAAPIRVGFAPGVEVRSLPVRFIGGGIDETQPLRLRRDPSTTGSVTFRVTPTAPELTAIVIVHNEDRSAVIQAAALSVAVVDSLDAAEAAPPSISMVRVDAAALSAATRTGAAAVVTDGTTTVATGPELSLPPSTDAVIRQIDDIVASIERAAARFLAAQAPIDTALVGVARAGVRVRTAAGLDALAPFDRIQVVSLTGQSVFPMDFVYSGDAPSTDATVCSAWRDALATGTCTECGEAGRPDVVCPLRFWGLAKVIEHHRGEPAGTSDYSARVQVTDDLVAIGAPTSTVVAASAQVFGPVSEPARPPAELLARLVEAASALGPVHVAADWTAWTTLVDAEAPAVLIAMPHQQRVDDAGIQAPALELGGTFETTFAERHVRRADATPGPLVMLIGCDTGVEERVLASFASQFRHWSPVVVATVGEVLADEAQHVAATVLRQVARATGTGATVGEAVRAARRELLAQSHLAGLQLVLHGDASWRIGTT